jgi:hypothetical protein
VVRCSAWSRVILAKMDVYRVADLVATRLASKYLDYVRTSKSIAKGDANPAHLPRLGTLLCTWIRADYLGSCADNLDQAPGSRNRGSELDADAEINFFYPPSAGEGRS